MRQKELCRPERRRMRLRAAAVALGFAVSACAMLPNVEQHVEEHEGARASFETSKGPLTRGQSAALLEALQRKSGNLDILQKHVAIEEAIVGSPLILGNKAVLLQDGPATYAAMLAALRAAKNHINFETYIIEDDEVGRQFADLLIAKQAKGIQVNLIYDSVGGLGTPPAFFDRLRQAGVAVLEFNPVNPLEATEGWELNHRDHRKLLVVDGRIAFVGGINIADAYSSGSFSSLRRGSGKPGQPAPGWRDTHIQVEGPVVADFQKLFIETWTQQQGEAPVARDYYPKLQAQGTEIVRVVGSSPDDPHSLIYLTLLSAIMHAEEHVYLTNAYFVPDPQLVDALQEAAQRGVDVRLMLPGESDSWLVRNASHSHYGDLLRAGVRIYERKGSVLHAKTASIDSVWSCVGSTNLDRRSFLHNSEIDAVVLGRDFARQMNKAFSADQAQSVQIKLEQWRRRPLLPRLQEIIGRLWEYWL